MKAFEAEQSSISCWNDIGVKGDLSCQQLKAVIHCYNCQVYLETGRSLFNREVPIEYLEDWTMIVSQSATKEIQATISLMIFRIGQELLALPVSCLQEIVVPTIVHRLPHRSNQLFLGLTNIRGETLVCISLAHLLSLNVDPDLAAKELCQRMIVAGNAEFRWVFPVDEVFGVHRFASQQLNQAPVVITKATETYTQYVLNWQGQKVNFLDTELLFYTLNLKILEG
jgi:chemotaxis-related protein WspD